MQNIEVVRFSKSQSAKKIGSHLGSSWGFRNSRVTLQGFDDDQHRIVAKTTEPFFSSHYIKVRDQNQGEFWLCKTSLSRRFSTSKEGLAELRRLFPEIRKTLIEKWEFFPSALWVDKWLLQPLLPKCSSQTFTDRDLENTLTLAQCTNVKGLIPQGGPPALPRPLLIGSDRKANPTIYFLFNEVNQGDTRLGSGGVGDVTHAIDLKSGEIVALKRCKKKPAHRLKAIKNEIEMMCKLIGKEGIVQHYFTFENDNDYYIVMEYCNGGDLFYKLYEERVKRVFSEEERLQLAIDIATGIRSIHQEGLAHGDLKLENILLNEQDDGGLKAKITDLGNATKTTDRNVLPDGTFAYWSPKKCAALLSKNREAQIDQQEEDIWAFGLILHMLFHESHQPLFKPPVLGPEESQADFQSRRNLFINQTANFQDRSRFPGISNPTICQLLAEIFTQQSRSKLTIEDVLARLVLAEVFSSDPL